MLCDGRLKYKRISDTVNQCNLVKCYVMDDYKRISGTVYDGDLVKCCVMDDYKRTKWYSV